MECGCFWWKRYAGCSSAVSPRSDDAYCTLCTLSYTHPRTWEPHMRYVASFTLFLRGAGSICGASGLLKLGAAPRSTAHSDSLETQSRWTLDSMLVPEDYLFPHKSLRSVPRGCCRSVRTLWSGLTRGRAVQSSAVRSAVRYVAVAAASPARARLAREACGAVKVRQECHSSPPIGLPALPVPPRRAMSSQTQPGIERVGAHVAEGPRGVQ